MVSFLVSQVWGIPIVAIAWLSWALWPSPADLITLLTIPTSMYLWRFRLWQDREVRKFVSVMLVILGYSIYAVILSWFRFEFPAEQLKYPSYVLFQLVRGMSVWFVALHVSLDRRAEEGLRWILGIVGGIVAVAALLQQYSILEYSSLVSHLPADPRISGPWAGLRRYSPDIALGTLGFNHIYAGHVLVVAFLMLVITNKIDPLRVALAAIIVMGLYVTQARSAWAALTVGIFYVMLASRQGRTRLAAGLAAVGSLVALALIWGWNPWTSGAIAARTETVSEGLMARLALQGEGVTAIAKDPISTLFGVGLGNLGFLVGADGFWRAHSQIVTAGGELGIIGCSLFFWLYMQVWRSINVKKSIGLTVRSILSASYASALVNDILLPSPAFGSYLFLLYCLAGIALRASMRDENSLRIR